MPSTKLEQAEQRLAQTEAVRTMVAKVRALLAGRTTRAEVKAWTREVWPPGSRGSPFSSPDANCMFDSLLSLEQRWGDHELVREVDLRALGSSIISRRSGKSSPGASIVNVNCRLAHPVDGVAPARTSRRPSPR